MLPIPETAISLALSYLAGAIPTSIWFCRAVRGVDIRTLGSGNAGATNVYRIMGVKAAVFVGAIDCLKGVAAVLIGRRLLGAQAEIGLIACGLAAILGHVYTIFAGFRGGKGVLVALGVFLTLSPVAALSSFLVWFAVMKMSRYVSLGSIVAAAMLPVFTFFYDKWNVFTVGKPIQIFTVVLTLLVFLAHRSNIMRLVAGTEKRVGKKQETV